MSELKESYNDTNDINTGKFLDVNNWYAQTFEASGNYDIESVKININWFASIPSGNLTVSIRATEDAGGGATKPTDADLASGTVACSSLPEFPSNTFTEITFSSSYTLVSGTTYAICVRTGVSSPDLYWRADSSSPTYTDGNWASSTNAGVVWSADTSTDFMFETWGTTTGGPPSDKISYKRLIAVGNNTFYYEDI